MSAPMRTFPAFVEVSRAAPLAIGGGDLAVAKVRVLLTRAPRFSLAAARVPQGLAIAAQNGAIELLAHAVQEADIRGRPLVVSATGDADEDARVAAIAGALGVLVNVPDRPELYTFAFGAFVDRGDVTVAISTDGAAPILATQLRAWLERELHPDSARATAAGRHHLTLTVSPA